MTKKKRYLSKDIFKVRNHIQRIFPHAKKVDVKIQKLPNGEYQSFIRVLGPQKKELFAQKKAQDIKRSLERSQMAIVRQIHRVKTKWEKVYHDDALSLTA